MLLKTADPKSTIKHKLNHVGRVQNTSLKLSNLSQNTTSYKESKSNLPHIKQSSSLRVQAVNLNVNQAAKSVAKNLIRENI